MAIFIVLFLVSILVQLSYWFFFYVNLASLSKREIKSDNLITGVTIIICAKNEAHNIRENFDYWSTQVSENDELIIVDDYSTDDTYHVATELCHNQPNFRCIKAKKDVPGKKQALIDGVEAAQNSFILLTDADCKPHANWRSTITKHVDEGTDFILGYGPFHSIPGMLNIFQRYECLFTAIQYYTYAHAGRPYMGVGRNLAFRKSAFSKDVYSTPIASGDDDLLVSAKANGSNTALCINPESFVFSESKKTLAAYINQKLRHISTSPYYKSSTKWLLSLFSTTQILSNVLFFYLVFTPFWNLILIIYIIRILVMTLTVKKAEGVFREPGLWCLAPILDSLLTLYYLLLTIFYPFKNRLRWN